MAGYAFWVRKLSFWFVLSLGLWMNGCSSGDSKDGSTATKDSEHARQDRDTASVRQPPLIETGSVKAADSTYRVKTYGYLKPNSEVALVSEVAGVVERVGENLFVGGFVKEGDLLFEIDSRTYQAQLDQAQALIKSGAIEVDKAKLGLERQRKLQKQNLSSDATTDEAEVRFAQAKAAHEQAKAQGVQAKKQLEDTQVKAVADMVVAAESLSVGSYVATGQQVAQLLYTDKAEVLVGVASKQADDVIRAMTATKASQVQIEGFDSVQARVKSVAPQIDAQARTVDFLVEVESVQLDPKQLKQAAGADKMSLVPRFNEYLKVRLPAQAMRSLWRVPTQALREEKQLWIVKDKRLQAVQVEVKARNNDFAQVQVTSKSEHSLLKDSKVMITRLNEERSDLKVQVQSAAQSN